MATTATAKRFLKIFRRWVHGNHIQIQMMILKDFENRQNLNIHSFILSFVPDFLLPTILFGWIINDDDNYRIKLSLAWYLNESTTRKKKLKRSTDHHHHYLKWMNEWKDHQIKIFWPFNFSSFIFILYCKKKTSNKNANDGQWKKKFVIRK